MIADRVIFDPFLSCLFFFLGLCLGSFATAIICREHKGIPWFDLQGENARSACPSCGKTLGVFELIPFFSWVFQKGKCRHCRGEIAFFYPMIEIISGFSALAILYGAGLKIALLPALILLPFLLSFGYLLLFHSYISKRLGFLCIFLVLSLCLLISA